MHVYMGCTHATVYEVRGQLWIRVSQDHSLSQMGFSWGFSCTRLQKSSPIKCCLMRPSVSIQPLPITS